MLSAEQEFIKLKILYKDNIQDVESSKILKLEMDNSRATLDKLIKSRYQEIFERFTRK
jgi:phosphoribosylformylglycinamidine (FGAM) synthase PurS component